MRVLLLLFLFLSLSSIIDAQSTIEITTTPSPCPAGVRSVMCFAPPCTVHSCKKGFNFCVNDYCGGCFAKCQCDANTDCYDGQECQSGFCVSTATTTAAPETTEVATTEVASTAPETSEVASTVAPSNCPSDVPTSECVCRHKNKFWAIGGFFDGCNSCQCTDDLRVICTQRICPIIPDDAPTDAPTTTAPSTINSTTINTCVITNDDYSMCQGGITPCSVVRCGTGPCVAHRCGDNNQCAAVCTCTQDSDCLTPGSRCAANKFGIKTCQDIPTPPPSTIPATPINTCLITNNDFSSCDNGMNPCASALCLAGTHCVAHKCENNQCAPVCACSDNSNCATGSICQANEFGIKVCVEDPSQTCPNGEPEVRCFAPPCSVAQRKCKKGNDFCVDDYCGGCNAKCQCDANSDCNDGEFCNADWKGRKFCTPCSEGKVCPAILCANRDCKYKCSINYCSCSDSCVCRRFFNDCARGEQCKFSSFFATEGKCVPRATTPPPATCNYNGRTYQPGSSFPSSDGCNTCRCGENGGVGCTKKACICPPNKGFATCKMAPCDAKPSACKTGATCINDYCGGCNTKCQCEINSHCNNDEICQADESGFSYCVKRTTTPRPTRSTTTTTTKTTTTTTPAPTTSECPGKVCPAILCANRPVQCTYGCGINYCSCTDFCKCRSDSHCAAGERCEGAAFGQDGKCVRRPRLLSQLDRF